MRPTIFIANSRSGGLWWRIPLALFLWLGLALPIVGGIAVVHTIRTHATGLPLVPNLYAWADNVPQSSLILAADNTVLAELPFRLKGQSGHRIPLRFEEIPVILKQAILAAEDIRFFEHKGVDLRSIVRAGVRNYQAGQVIEGASTITQQLARNIVPDIGNEKSVRRKIREALLARRIEKHYSKPTIFENYANFVFLGANAYGFAAASRAYFAKPVAEVSLAEAALLAGLIQIPGRGNPYNNPNVAKARRNVVLQRMQAANMIDDQQLAQAIDTPILLTAPPERYGFIAPWVTEHARQLAKKNFPDSFARGGLTIETTIHPQVAAASAMATTEHLSTIKNEEGETPQAAALVFDNYNGYISVMVGGQNWQDNQFNRATQGCRQPGSAFKPMVYGAALENKVITPATALRDGPISEYDPELMVFWKPSNSGREFRGLAIAQDALASSLNTPAVDVFDRVGSKAVVDFSLRLGITTPLRENRPLALGASCVRPIELARAFSVIANNGYDVRPIALRSVVDRGQLRLDRSDYADPWLSASRRLDRIVQQASIPEQQVLDEQTAFQLRSMLRAVVTNGTGRAARQMPMPVAGKTGTTNDNVDAWFVGFSSHSTAAVWLGHDDPHKNLGRGHDGSHAALPLWKRIMSLAPNAIGEELPGEAPAGMESAQIDRDSGLLAAPKSGSSIKLYFKAGMVPNEVAENSAQVNQDFARSTSSF